MRASQHVDICLLFNICDVMRDNFSHSTNSRIERRPAGGAMHWLTQLEFRIWVWFRTVSYSGLIYVCGVRVAPRPVVRGKRTNGSEIEPIDCYRHTWISPLLLPWRWNHTNRQICTFTYLFSQKEKANEEVLGSLAQAECSLYCQTGSREQEMN